MSKTVENYSWNDLELKGNEMYFKIKNQYGEISKKEYNRIFSKYIEKFFNTWDLYATCINGDYQYPPVLFCWYAEMKGIEPTFPLRIMKKVAVEINKI